MSECSFQGIHEWQGAGFEATEGDVHLPLD